MFANSQSPIAFLLLLFLVAAGGASRNLGYNLRSEQETHNRALAGGSNPDGNPLHCIARTLNDGDALLPGEAVCFWTGQYHNSTRGAFEFGLNQQGQPIYYDHRTQDQVVVVWHATDVLGTSLQVKAGGGLALMNSDGATVWQVGGCGFASAKSTLTVSSKGIVSLESGNDLMWTVGLDLAPQESCT